MNSFMAVAVFKPEVTVDDIRELIPAEMAQAKILEEEGKLGAIKVSMARRTVFLETFADSEASAMEAISSLPFIKLWDVDIFPITPPSGTAL